MDLFGKKAKAENKLLKAKLEVARSIVDLVDSKFLAMDRHGNTGDNRNTDETGDAWSKFWQLVSKIY